MKIRVLLLLAILIGVVSAKVLRQQELASEWHDTVPTWAAESVDRLATNFLQIFSKSDPNNMVISPYGLWSVLLIIFQAADKETASEIQSSLLLPNGKKNVSDGYFSLNNDLINSRPKDGREVSLNTYNFLVRNKTGTLDRSKEFFSLLKNRYRLEVFPVALQNIPNSVNAINQRISDLTNGRITHIVSPDDLEKLQYLIGNVIYFKGHWLNPFNENETFTDEFKDEQDKIIGHIPMMSQMQMFPYSFNKEIDSQIVEIPYADGRTSMIVILPRRKVTVNDVLVRMKNRTLTEILDDGLTSEEIELYLPRFNFTNEFVVNAIVEQIGIKRIFSPMLAQLPLLSNSSFISRIVQKVEVENNEEGTTASAVTVAQVTYKTGSVTFHANRPFIFFINDIKTRAILFSGLFRTPS